ncbi:transposase [Archangium minus]|uniref:Transposase n=1 Tax=Archangium minus TaxID=83450 RepID=A0ABY9XC00_9BACT|nr:transposase [Archangium minus]
MTCWRSSPRAGRSAVSRNCCRPCGRPRARLPRRRPPPLLPRPEHRPSPSADRRAAHPLSHLRRPPAPLCRVDTVEDTVLLRLRELIPGEVKVTVLADRGFADQALYALLAQLGFSYVVRFRKSITVTNTDGERKPAGSGCRSRATCARSKERESRRTRQKWLPWCA